MTIIDFDGIGLDGLKYAEEVALSSLLKRKK